MKKILPVLLALLLLPGCFSDKLAGGLKLEAIAGGCVSSFSAFGEGAALTVYGDNAEVAAESASELIKTLDNSFSTSSASSYVSQINSHGGEGVAVDADTADAISVSLEMSHLTGGAFDITVYPALAAYGLYSGKLRVPTDDEISALLPLIGFQNVTQTGEEIHIAAGMGIDLCGIASGYAVRRAADMLTQHGVLSARVSVGGCSAFIGTGPDDALWQLSLADPRDPTQTIGDLSLSDCAAATCSPLADDASVDGTSIHRVIDPASGRPANSDLLSVTVVCGDCAKADALADALFVMGEADAMEFWRETGGFEAALVTTDGRLVLTDGLAQSFAPSERCPYEIVHISKR